MTLHVFNPENDLALACFEPHFIPPRSARKMADDLAVLPAWWAQDGDGVCVPSPVEAVRFMEQPDAMLCPRVQWVARTACAGYDRVQPWGWSPLLVRTLSDGGCSAGILPDSACLLRYRDWSGRRHAVDLLRFLTSRIVCDDWGGYLCGKSYYCTDEDTLIRLLASIPDTILKAPWSGSGKGLRLGRTGFVPPLSGWCRRLLREQGGIVVEPIYNKVYDFAMEFEADGSGGAVYRGLSVFSTTHQGVYAGNWVAVEEVKEEWLARHIPAGLFAVLRKELSAALGRTFYGYCGPLGVDMMLCRVPDVEHLCVHPCVEVNLRRTMGMVSIDLARYLSPGAEGRFVIDYEKQDSGLLTKQKDEQTRYPIALENGKLVSGCLPLTPVTPDTHYRAVLYVGVEPHPA